MATVIRILALTLFAQLAIAADAFDIQPYREAHGRFMAMLSAGDSGQPKDLRTPEFTRLVTVMSDEKRFLRARKFTRDDMPVLMDLSEMANKNDVSLLFFGVKSRMDPNWSQEDKVRNLVPMIQRNAIDFQAELTTLQPFHIHCMELQMPLLEEFIRALPPDQMTPVRRDGLAKMRNGYAQMLTGMLQNMGDANFGVGYRGAVTNAIADASPALVSVLSLAQRAQLLEVVKQGESSTPSDFKAARARIEKALKNPACSELCAF
jgi:hypothetical protein